jgi:hypothetical protein
MFSGTAEYLQGVAKASRVCIKEVTQRLEVFFDRNCVAASTGMSEEQTSEHAQKPCILTSEEADQERLHVCGDLPKAHETRTTQTRRRGKTGQLLAVTKQTQQIGQGVKRGEDTWSGSKAAVKREGQRLVQLWLRRRAQKQVFVPNAHTK